LGGEIKLLVKGNIHQKGGLKGTLRGVAVCTNLSVALEGKTLISLNHQRKRVRKRNHGVVFTRRPFPIKGEKGGVGTSPLPKRGGK